MGVGEFFLGSRQAHAIPPLPPHPYSVFLLFGGVCSGGLCFVVFYAWKSSWREETLKGYDSIPQAYAG